ncbi:MAG: hypothetical protein Q8O51_00020 [bacterium]|nr:hypothetical protein [bacterium]
MAKHAEKHETHQHHTTTPRQRVWVIAFVVAAAVLFAGVLFLATGKSRIAFTWTPQPVESTTTLTVAAAPTGDDIPAAFLEKSVEVSKIFTAETKATTPQPVPSTPTVTTFTGKARGKVTIYNRYSKAQPLIAGTRLKSPDGQIFRTQQRVDVPVGGSVTTEVMGDVAGEKGALPKGTTFILPALWAGLQDKITGVSTENFHGESQAATTSTTPGLTANELANAEQVLLQEAIAQALPDLQNLVPTGRTLYPGMVDATTVKRTGPAIGDKATTYTLTLTVKTTAVTVDSTKLTDSATALLTTSLSPDLQLLSVNPSTFGYTLKSTDTKKQRADVTLIARGTTVPAPAHRLLQQATFAGKTADEVRALLAQEKAASNVVVALTPFWNRRVPSSANDLQLEVTRAK